MDWLRPGLLTQPYRVSYSTRLVLHPPHQILSLSLSLSPPPTPPHPLRVFFFFFFFVFFFFSSLCLLDFVVSPSRLSSLPLLPGTRVKRPIRQRHPSGPTPHRLRAIFSPLAFLLWTLMRISGQDVQVLRLGREKSNARIVLSVARRELPCQ